MQRSRGRGLAALSAVLLAIVLPMRAAGANPDLEADFVARINALRVAKGAAPLVVDAELTSIGRAWASRMAAAGTISHNPDFPAQVRASWTKLGENVGKGGEVGPLFQAFVDSPTHYSNLVDPSFTHVGVGVVVSGNLIFTAHQFMTLAPARVPAPAATGPAPAATRPAPAATRPAPAAPAAARPASAPRPPAATRRASAPATPGVPALPPVHPALVDVLAQLRGLER